MIPNIELHTGEISISSYFLTKATSKYAYQILRRGRVVTGSSHLIVLDDGFKILLDCGMFQGGENYVDSFNATFEFDPKEIDVLILSHAHIDHSGRIPKLVKEGFSGKIYCTSATKDLCGIMLRDSAHIQENDAKYVNKNALKETSLLSVLCTIRKTPKLLSNNLKW